jgi:arsenate reductase (thioredoxin)
MGLTMKKPRVLFLCTGNTARSQMAEAFVRKYAGDRLDPHSAGLEPKMLSPYAIQVMDEIGIDISGQRSKGVDTYLGKVFFSYMITVCDHAEKNCPTAWMGIQNRLHWSLDDPAKFEGSEAEKLTKFRQVRDQIDILVQNWLAEVLQV